MQFGTPGLATLVRTAAVVAPLYFFVNTGAGRRRRSRCRRGSRWSASGSATSSGARRAIWPARALAAVADGGVGARLVRMARAARGAALSRLPQLPHGRRAAARRAGRDAARDGRAAGDDRSARARDRSQGGLHPRAHPIDPAVRGDAGRSGRPVGPRRAGGAHRGAAARHRQHGGARAHPVEARCAHARGVRARQDSPARRRRDPAQRARSARRSASWCSAITSAGTAWATRPGCAARTFRSARASWRSPTATARCRPIARTARPAARRGGRGAARVRRHGVRPGAGRPADRPARHVGGGSGRRRGCRERVDRRTKPMALQDIAGAHREEQTLYEIAQALGSSLGVADAMALIQDKVSRLVPFTTCALFLGDDERGVRLPLRARPRHRSAVQVDAEVVERHRAAAAVVRRRPRRARRGADGAAAVPADVRAAADRRPGDLPHRARAASPTSTAACSAASASRPRR